MLEGLGYCRRFFVRGFGVGERGGGGSACKSIREIKDLGVSEFGMVATAGLPIVSIVVPFFG